MRLSRASIVILIPSVSDAFQAFVPLSTSSVPHTRTKNAFASSTLPSSFVASSATNSRIPLQMAEEDDEENPFNPYADPNYPELEFVNYDDPEYEVDQGVTDEYFDTDAEVEQMREDRRRKNDEFQFETYHAETLKSGDTYKGEWTVYRTSTFLETSEEVGDVPAFKKEKKIRKVVTKGNKIFLDPPVGGFEFRVDGERIVHEERLAEAEDFEDDEEWEEYAKLQGNQGGTDFVGKTFWPKELGAKDFRGEAGIMCVGNCYTICDSTPLNGIEKAKDDFDGPFSELRTEVGIQYKRLRLRVKFDYRVKADESNEENPALHLYSMVVCREARERWPRYETKSNIDDSISETLFGAAGAPGGLYDPPPVGSDEQAMQYMLLDLDGYASVLFPYKIDQDPDAHDGNGWVQSLDWSPGRIRLQADRKVLGGVKLRGLKTLELTEVEAEAADQWRPNDDGENMRQ